MKAVGSYCYAEPASRYIPLKAFFRACAHLEQELVSDVQPRRRLLPKLLGHLPSGRGLELEQHYC